MNPTLTTLFNHRSIRQFTPEKLTTDEVATLITAAQHAATSTFPNSTALLASLIPLN